MANRRPVQQEELEHLLDFIQKGKFFALQEWLKAGKFLRVPDNAGLGENVLRIAVTTGFHSIVEELLRAGGWSPIELADALDQARCRKREDIADLIQQYSTHPNTDALPTRVKRCLSAAGIPIEKQAVLHALRTGVLSWRTTLYGKYTHRDLCRWLGIDESLPLPPIPLDPSPPFPKNGLSYRANGLLRRAGIPADKSAIRQALETRALEPGKRPYNYGKQTHAELCRWVGVDPTALP
jgi:hypothetical protein